MISVSFPARAARPVLAVFSLFAFVSGAVAETACSIDRQRIERGETAQFMICGADLPKNFALTGLENADINVDYAQWIRKCSPDSKQRGLYLWLTAGDAAVPADLGVVDQDTGAAACNDFSLDVPDTIRLGEARLKPIRHAAGTAYRLTVEAGEARNLSAACAGSVEFLSDSDEPQISLFTEQEMPQLSTDDGQFGPSDWYSLPNSTKRRKKAPAQRLVCDRKELTAYVHVTGQQRMPAKVIVNNLGGDLEGRKGIAYVALPEPEWADSMPDDKAKYIEVNGYRTRYFVKGKGPDTLILVHGGQPDPISPTAQAWQQNFAALAKDFRVIAFDNLGHGYTDNPRAPEDYERYYELIAEHLYGFIQALELDRVHLVGHSQGGWPAMRVALDHPELVQCLVSAASVVAPLGGESNGTRNFAYMLTSIMPAGEPTIESMYRERQFIGHTANNLYWPDFERRYALTKRPELTEAKNALARIRMSPGHPYFRSLRETALEELAAGKLDVPHLIVWGRNDPMADYELGLEFFELASTGSQPTELLAVNQAGHSMMVEYPERFNEAVLGFCGNFRSKAD